MTHADTPCPAKILVPSLRKTIRATRSLNLSRTQTFLKRTTQR